MCRASRAKTLFCVIGHMFPVFYGFKGGKGILCSGTLLLLLD